MKYKILSFFIILFIFPIISAGNIIVTPNPVEGGNYVSVTIYASPADPMDCNGVISVSGKTTVVGFISFNCDTHCRCYGITTTKFFVNESLKGDYSVNVWDYSKGDASSGGFNVIKNKCFNGVKDGNETDIDCGGGKCSKCADEKGCLNKTDCISGNCDFDHKCRKISVINSTRNMNKYSNKEAFIVSDEDWEEVLKLVPLSSWNENSKKIKYPVLIYHNEGGAFDFDSGIHFLQLYSPSHVTIFGETPEKLDKLLISNNDATQEEIRDNAGKYLGLGLDEDQVSKISLNDYYSYWNQINEVVVSSDDYKTGLMASVFASYKNAPIMFEDEISYGVLAGKKVYVIGDINNKTLKNIKNVSSETVVYNDLEVQKEYIKLTSSDKAIVVNPNDLGIKLDKTFRTDKSSKIREIYNKNSLAAPFLAALREEVIINVNTPSSPDNSNCNNNINITNNFNLVNNSIKDQIKNIGFEPEYLTIIASPNSIPDSIYDKCHKSGYQFRNSTDYIYASFKNETLDYGRIYGIDVADTSSYVASDIFYENISYKLYGNNSTGISIGHSFDSHMDHSQTIFNASKNSGYESVCYTGENRDGCIKKYSPPITEYSKKQFIIFGDHGFSDEWEDTLKSSKVPYLDLSYVFAHACSTNNFWEGEEKLMSAKMIRKGAIAYQGAVGVSYADSSELAALKKLTSSDISLGELNKELADEFLFYKRYYLLTGDPVFKPGLKNINWNGYETGDDSNESGNVEVANGWKGNITSIISDKPLYNPLDKIIIKTKVKNVKNSSEDLYLEYNIFSEDEKYDSELVLKKINLDSNEEKEFNFSMDVSPTMPSGNYNAVVRLSDGGNELDKKEVSFSINGTLKTMDLILKSCEDKDCINEARVFGKNETIYLDYENPADANMTALLVYPDGSETKINLPYNFTSNNTGNYKLILNATKQGYEEFVDEMIFGITEDANISIEETCNLDGVCDNNESIQNCPQDCVKVNLPEENETENITCYDDFYCNDDNLFTEDHCINPGDINSSCSHLSITCFYDSDCGNNTYIGTPFCGENNDLLRNYLTFTCNNNGTSNSYCSNSTSIFSDKTCLTNQLCSNGNCFDVTCFNDSSCNDFNLYTFDKCNNPGTVNSNCSHIAIKCLNEMDCNDLNSYTEDKCDNPGTVNSNCVNSPIICFNLTDCGNNGWIGDSFCNSNNVFKNYINYICNNPGSVSSSCDSFISPKLDQTCGPEELCSWGVCQNVTCFNDSQCDDNNYRTEDRCNNPGELNSSCSNLPIDCFNDYECGTNRFIEDKFCIENNVFWNYLTYTCNNNGTSSSYCSNSTSLLQIESCTSTQFCSEGACKDKTESSHNNYPFMNNIDENNQEEINNHAKSNTGRVILDEAETKTKINLSQAKEKEVNSLNVNPFVWIIGISILILLLLILIMIIILRNR